MILIMQVLLLGTSTGCHFDHDSKEHQMLAEQSLAMHERIEIVRTTDWRVTRIDGQDVPHQAERGAHENIMVMLEADDRVRGSTGVNNYAGGYKLIAPDELRFTQLVSTRRAGPPEFMERERRFVDALERIRSFRLIEEPERNRLELIDARDKVLIEAVAEQTARPPG